MSGTMTSSSGLLRRPLSLLQSRGRGGEAIRYALVGASNTLLSVLLYQLLVFVLSPGWSFTIAYVAGLAFAAIAYPTVVFRQGWRPIDGIKVVLVYLVLYGLGRVVLDILSRYVDSRLAILAVVVINAVAGFVLLRLVLRGSQDGASDEQSAD